MIFLVSRILKSLVGKRGILFFFKNLILMFGFDDRGNDVFQRHKA